ncbi:MAG TPA: class I SAM-dependent methyltransferase [Steroidobacteraceae bacterium]|nr:class I SAM-dependent methyltransferase [Steroidobacteraceae bacterium]
MGQGDDHSSAFAHFRKGERPLLFDAGFYRRYYLDPRTRVASRADAFKLGRFACAYADYLGFTVRRVLDAGCGLGHLRAAVKERFPRARYVGLEASAYLCRRHGWVHGSIADYAPREGFDLVFCHDVLQYLDDRAAMRSLSNLGRLCRGGLYFSVLTAGDWRRNADRARTDSGVKLRPAAWYRARLQRRFRHLGGGLHARRGYEPLLWELERPV